MNLKDYVTSIKNKHIGVIGIGISNLPLIRLLAFEGCDVTACDIRSFDKLGPDALDLISRGVKLRLGDNYLDNLNFDLIFRTPGLMPFDEHLVKAKTCGAEITSEMELFFKLCPCKTIAVTGSDGKTTTTSIIAEILKQAGYTVHLGGNIGKPLLCEVPFMKPSDYAVLELSSFQLHSMFCAPDIAVITNISPNHLDKHIDFDDYVSAKKNIFKNQKSDGLLIINDDDNLVSTFPGNRSFSLNNNSNGAYVADNKIFRNNNFLMNVDDIKLPGVHNLKNFLAAFSATIDIADDDACVNVGKNFNGVEHRLETVCTVNGVTFINDSIGSSPSRTIAGLEAMKDKPVIILGGYDKHIPFDELGKAVVKLAKKAILTGDTASQIYESIINAGDMDCYLINDFDAAVIKAYSVADRGDTVLFSPACASFDHFKNFEERGNHFKELVKGICIED